MKRYYDHEKKTARDFETQIREKLSSGFEIVAEMEVIKQFPTFTNNEVKEYLNRLRK